MGDVVTLVEKAVEHVDREKAEKLAKKMKKGELDFNDLADQLTQMRKMGGMQGLSACCPGIGKVKDQLAAAGLDDRILKRQEAIISSMTKEERAEPDLINGSRRKRIAGGAGVEVSDVNKILKMQRQMSDVMKKMGKGGRGMMGALGGGMNPQMLSGGFGGGGCRPACLRASAASDEVRVNLYTDHMRRKPHVIEDQTVARRHQEASSLPHRHRRIAQSARRPLHRPHRLLQSAAAEGSRRPAQARPRQGEGLARQGRDRVRPRAPLPRRCRRASKHVQHNNPREGEAEEEGAGTRQGGCGRRRRRRHSAALAGRVLLGAVIGAHGIKGEVRVKTFTLQRRTLLAPMAR